MLSIKQKCYRNIDIPDILTMREDVFSTNSDSLHLLFVHLSLKIKHLVVYSFTSVCFELEDKIFTVPKIFFVDVRCKLLLMF